MLGSVSVAHRSAARSRHVRSLEVPTALQEEAEVGRRLDMVLLQTPPPCRLGAIEVALLVEQDPEVERGIAIPPLLRALVRRLGGSELALLMQQHAQVEGAPGVPGRVGAAIHHLGALACLSVRRLAIRNPSRRPETIQQRGAFGPSQSCGHRGCRVHDLRVVTSRVKISIAT